MKTLDEIKADRIAFGMRSAEINGIKMLCGMIYDRNQKIYFTLGDDEDGWEHVAIHVGDGRKAPSWEVMCKAKATFWHDDEDVIQLHPKKKEYFHGVHGMEVLHLWRPKDGDWSMLNSGLRR